MPNFNLKKLWKRKSVNITEYDPSYRVIYLGNVLTGWAKGEGCVEKPLSTLWRNYCQSNRPDIVMKVTICGAGLRAVTKEHGLTEYWAHRVTYCVAHAGYPKVFCWVYRHEGRRLKQELRCHAVLCTKQTKAEVMSAELKDRLNLALNEFRREKAIRQNARLSVMSAVYDTATFPMRKLYLVTGVSNYRPPLERSKSAPKLSAIEELQEEEEAEERKDITLKINPKRPSIRFLQNEVCMDLSNPPHIPMVSSLDDILVSLDEVQKRLSSKRDLYCSLKVPSDIRLHEPVKIEQLDSSQFEVAFSDILPVSATNLVIHHNREDSVTSDQPESISSHSCNSSCGGCSDSSTDEAILRDVEDSNNGVSRPIRKSSLKKELEEEDNISEESGYSEAKDYLANIETCEIQL